MTPAGRLNTSHGILLATPTAAIANASRVTDDASQTSATAISPSPRFAAVADVKSLR